jgi:hypothetical protein
MSVARPESAEGWGVACARPRQASQMFLIVAQNLQVEARLLA